MNSFLEDEFTNLVDDLMRIDEDPEFSRMRRKLFINNIITNLSTLNNIDSILNRSYTTDPERLNNKNAELKGKFKPAAEKIYKFLNNKAGIITPSDIHTLKNIVENKRLEYTPPPKGGRRKSGGGCGCMVPRQGGYRTVGGYRATKKDKKYLKMYKQGKSIGFTMTASLKAKGLIPRANGTRKVSNKYR
jgi:hypothetical protein